MSVFIEREDLLRICVLQLCPACLNQMLVFVFLIAIQSDILVGLRIKTPQFS